MRKLKSRLARKIRVMWHHAQHRHGREMLAGTVGILLGCLTIGIALRGNSLHIIGPLASFSLAICGLTHYFSRR